MNCVGFCVVASIGLLLLSEAHGSVSKRVHPSDALIATGSPLRFECHTSTNGTELVWTFKKPGEVVVHTVANGSYVTQRFRSLNFNVTADLPGSSALMKMHSELNDAGVYECVDYDATGEVIFQESARLALIGSEPECSMNATVVVKGDCLQMSCGFEHSVNIFPSIKWSKYDTGNVTNGVESNTGNNRVHSTLTKYVTAEDHDTVLSCSASFKHKFQSGKNEVGRRTLIIPDNMTKCTFHLNVLFPPKSIGIIPMKDIYEIGDELECLADGNPPPTYEWTDLGWPHFILNGSLLKIDNMMLQKRTFQCTAMNGLGSTGGILSTTVTVDIIEATAGGVLGASKTSDKSIIDNVTSSPSAVIVGIIGCMLLVIGFAVAFRRYRGQKPKYPGALRYVRNDLVADPNDRGIPPGGTGGAMFEGAPCFDHVTYLSDGIAQQSQTGGVMFEGAECGATGGDEQSYSPLGFDSSTPKFTVYTEYEELRECDPEYLEPRYHES